jgi:hypothetical protein
MEEKDLFFVVRNRFVNRQIYVLFLGIHVCSMDPKIYKILGVFIYTDRSTRIVYSATGRRCVLQNSHSCFAESFFSTVLAAEKPQEQPSHVYWGSYKRLSMYSECICLAI